MYQVECKTWDGRWVTIGRTPDRPSAEQLRAKLCRQFPATVRVASPDQKEK